VKAVETHPHQVPQDLSDRIALAATRLLRGARGPVFRRALWSPRRGSRDRGRRAERGGATATHPQSLRRMVDDDGWIRTLMEDAENERMHLINP
jgi:ubiquinol oxidase